MSNTKKERKKKRKRKSAGVPKEARRGMAVAWVAQSCSAPLAAHLGR